jgi:hypothetical protein
MTRREFLEMTAGSAVSALHPKSGESSVPSRDYDPGPFVAEFSGLCAFAIANTKKSMKVHMVGDPHHLPVLIARMSDIAEPAASIRPAYTFSLPSAFVTAGQALATTSVGIWLLAGKQVSVHGVSGSTLNIPMDSIGNLTCPDNYDDPQLSLGWLPNAKEIFKKNKFDKKGTTTVALDAGSVAAIMPSHPAYQRARLQFFDEMEKRGSCRAFADRLRYSFPFASKQVVLDIGGKTITFAKAEPQQPAIAVSFCNLPVVVDPKGAVQHFNSFQELFNTKSSNIIILYGDECTGAPCFKFQPFPPGKHAQDPPACYTTYMLEV